MEFSIEKMYTMEKTMETELQKLFRTVNVNSSSDVNQSVLAKLSKSSMSNFISSFVTLIENNIELCKTAAVKLDQLKTEQLESQKKLLEIQEDQITGVQNVIKTEIKSWADVVKQNDNESKQITSKTVKKAVRTVNDEEKRSRNVMIYGLEECDNETGEDLADHIRSVYENATLALPDTTEGYYRVGKKQPDKNRPVKVMMQTTTEARLLLQNARKLKSSNLSTVYVGPDRSKDERAAHKKLLIEIKQMIEKDSTKHYYIRDNKIKIIDKRLSPDNS